MKKITKNITAVFLLLLVIISQTACGEKEPVTSSGIYLDTQCDITIYDMDRSEAEEILKGAFEEIERCEGILSRTIEGSDVDRINGAQGKAVKVDKITLEAVEAGLEVGRYSDGQFDISIGAVSSLWDFKGENPSVPENSLIEEKLDTVDYTKVKVEGDRISSGGEETMLDLGGIAKGYVADIVTDYLEERGVERGIINLGGNVVTIGSKGDEGGFVIGVERPYSDRSEIIGAVEVSDKTVVTSGIYERMFTEKGKMYHHILDPKTGYPVETDLEAVTIVADRGNSGFCDGLSTACIMAGYEDGQKLLARMQEEHPEMNLEALFIDRDDNMAKTDGMEIDIR